MDRTGRQWLELIWDSLILGDREERVFKGEVLEYLNGDTALGSLPALCSTLDGFIVVSDDLQLLFCSLVRSSALPTS